MTRELLKGHFMLPRTSINELLLEMEEEIHNDESREAVGYGKALLRIRTEFNIPREEPRETRR